MERELLQLGLDSLYIYCWIEHNPTTCAHNLVPYDLTGGDLNTDLYSLHASTRSPRLPVMHTSALPMSPVVAIVSCSFALINAFFTSI